MAKKIIKEVESDPFNYTRVRLELLKELMQLASTKKNVAEIYLKMSEEANKDHHLLIAQTGDHRKRAEVGIIMRKACKMIAVSFADQNKLDSVDYGIEGIRILDFLSEKLNVEIPEEVNEFDIRFDSSEKKKRDFQTAVEMRKKKQDDKIRKKAEEFWEKGQRSSLDKLEESRPKSTAKASKKRKRNEFNVKREVATRSAVDQNADFGESEPTKYIHDGQKGFLEEILKRNREEAAYDKLSKSLVNVDKEGSSSEDTSDSNSANDED